MKLVKPKKRPPSKKREPVGVGAKPSEGEDGGGPAASPDHGGDAPAERSVDEPTDGTAADGATETE
jgi:hypothetical protein